jgi:hypothetical protein
MTPPSFDSTVICPGVYTPASTSFASPPHCSPSLVCIVLPPCACRNQTAFVLRIVSVSMRAPVLSSHVMKRTLKTATRSSSGS